MDPKEKSAIESILTPKVAAPAPPPPPEPKKPKVKVPMKHLKAGRVSFRSRYGALTTYPCGVPTQTLIDGRLVLHSPPRVVFDQHVYTTPDPAIAEGMVRHQGFEDKALWLLNEECLPDKLQGRYHSLHVENRRLLVLALIQGATAAEAVEALDPEYGDLAPPAPEAPVAHAYICPVCSATAPGGGNNPGAVLKNHVRMMHPEYDGPVG